MQKALKYFVILGCFALIFGLSGCKDSKDKNEKEVSYLEKNAKTFSQKIDLKGIDRVSLSSKAEKACSDWIEYLTVKSEIRKLQDFTLQDLISDSGNLLKSVEQLQKTIPENLNAIPVQSRIVVLLTKAHVLDQETQRHKIDAQKIEKSGQDIFKAFTDLKIQLNEVFLQHLRDFDFDIDKAQDSIQKAKQEKLNDSVSKGK